MRTFKLTLEYDGTDFHGWQVQPDRRTVQGEVERAIAEVARERVRIHGASRTDAGVHALGQVASFAASTRLEPPVLARALNAVLPEDVSVVSCEEAREGFHARRDARGKHYSYRILNRPEPCPLERRHAHHVRERLDVRAMHEAAQAVLGEHDFSAFETDASLRRAELEEAGRDLERASVRRISAVRVTARTTSFASPTPANESILVVLDVAGTGFLYNMVRSLAGTLVQVGRGKIPPGELARILASRERANAGPTAPPRGLFLAKVFYDEEARLPDPERSGPS